MRTWILVSALSLFFPALSQAKIITKTVEYMEGTSVMEGFLAMPENTKGPLPGVLVVHEWMGVGPYVKKRAEQLAELGYVAFAADIYGKGVRPKTPAEAAKTAEIYKSNRPLMRARAEAALNQLRKVKEVNVRELAAIGYCFGGTTVLELARAGNDLKGIVSFHGGLSTPSVDDAKNIKAKVLVLHGADDPMVPATEVAAFEEEMRKGGVDWELVKYSKSVHSFTNPESGSDNSKGAAYNAEADRRSWKAMKAFFQEIFSVKPASV